MHNVDYKKYKPDISIEQFSELLLATLANNTMIKNFSKPNIKIASLPFDYTCNIAKIMHENDNFKICFSKLIDFDAYYSDQIDWEKSLGERLDYELKKANKKIEVSFENERLYINYTEEEIKNVLSKYDEEIVKLMKDFAYLINSYSFSRTFDLEQHQKEESDSIRQNAGLFVKVFRMIQHKN